MIITEGMLVTEEQKEHWDSRNRGNIGTVGTEGTEGTEGNLEW